MPERLTPEQLEGLGEILWRLGRVTSGEAVVFAGSPGKGKGKGKKKKKKKEEEREDGSGV